MTGSAASTLVSLFPKHDLSAYLVPSSDAHQSEYTTKADARRAFISGFTGSAGLAVLMKPEYGKHALFTDGRYFTQALNELNASEFELQKQGVPEALKLEDFLLKRLPAKSRVGVDASTMSVSAFKTLQTAFGDDLTLVAIDENLVDSVWKTRPSYPAKPIIVHSEKYAGESHLKKFERVRAKMREAKVEQLIVSTLDEVAWLLNCRGSDVDYNPVFIAYVIVTLDSVTLFVDKSQVTDEVRNHLTDAVRIQPYNQFFSALSQSVSSLSPTKKVWIDTGKCNYAIYHAFKDHVASIHEADSPIALMKALKNEVELAGVRAAHRRDSAAMVNFLAWLEDEVKVGTDHTEVTLADKLESFRSQQSDFMGLSFSTIAGSGDNGAIIHYHPQPGSCAGFDPTRVLLLDSGGQYRDGTTDITRTFHFGQPTSFECHAYTRVLQGHIGLASAVWPHGAVGPNLDVLARQPLWLDGLDYQHGTGHGVGAFLNVHEGPHGVSASVRSPTMLNTPLTPGMLVTNEPGYYHTGDSKMIVSKSCGGDDTTHRGFGIRIENLCIVVEAQTPQRFAGKPYYTFDTVTLTPISRSLIKRELLSQREIDWLNTYHARCRAEISPLVQGKAREWLERETRPL